MPRSREPVDTSWDLLHRGPGLRKGRMRDAGDTPVAPHLFPLAQWAADLPEDQERPVLMTIPGDLYARMALYTAYMHPDWRYMRAGTVDDMRDVDLRSWLKVGPLADLTARERNLGQLELFIEAIRRWFTAAPLREQDLELLRSAEVQRLPLTDAQRVDVLYFLLVLATQNVLLTRAIFGFDGLEQLAEEPNGRAYAKQLHLLVTAVERWNQEGPCPIGFLVGFTGDKISFTQLRKLHPRLAQVAQAGLAWTTLTVGGQPDGV